MTVTGQTEPIPSVRGLLVRLHMAGAGSESIATASGVSAGSLRSIRNGLRNASIDESCRIVGLVDFLDELTSGSTFEDLTEVLSWIERPLAPWLGGYLRPVDVLAVNDLEVVESLARVRSDDQQVAEVLDSANYGWRTEFEVFTASDRHRAIRARV